jgi:hypothetical protein
VGCSVPSPFPCRISAYGAGEPGRRRDCPLLRAPSVTASVGETAITKLALDAVQRLTTKGKSVPAVPGRFPVHSKCEPEAELLGIVDTRHRSAVDCLALDGL